MTWEMPAQPASDGGYPTLLEKVVPISQDAKGQIICRVNGYLFLGDSKQIYILKVLESSTVKILIKLNWVEPGIYQS